MSFERNIFFLAKFISIYTTFGLWAKRTDQFQMTIVHRLSPVAGPEFLQGWEGQ